MANNHKIPTPFSENKYSGKFQVRITEEEHRQLALSSAVRKLF